MENFGPLTASRRRAQVVQRLRFDTIQLILILSVRISMCAFWTCMIYRFSSEIRAYFPWLSIGQYLHCSYWFARCRRVALIGVLAPVSSRKVET